MRPTFAERCKLFIAAIWNGDVCADCGNSLGKGEGKPRACKSSCQDQPQKKPKPRSKYANRYPQDIELLRAINAANEASGGASLWEQIAGGKYNNQLGWDSMSRLSSKGFAERAGSKKYRTFYLTPQGKHYLSERD